MNTRGVMDENRQWFDEALAAFNEGTPGLLAWEDDARETVVLMPGGRRMRVMGRSKVAPAACGALKREAEALAAEAGMSVLAVAEYASAGVCDLLRELGVCFVDTAGNAYVQLDEGMIFVKGNRRPTKTGVKGRLTRLFQAAGMRLVLELLREPELANATYRELAAKAEVSLGSVTYILQDMQAAGNLLERHGARELTNGQRLLNAWCERYRDSLRCRYEEGRYRAGKPDWWQTATLPAGQAWWGGEVAVARQDGGLRPQVVTLYHRGDITQLLGRAGMVPAAAGEVEVLGAFWQPNEADGEQAPDVVTYADLLTSGSPRNIEVAERLYEERLAGRFARWSA